MIRSLKIKTLFLVVSFMLSALSACKKDVAGPKGDPGVPAKMGNSKQSDRSFTIYPSAWTFDGVRYSTLVYFPEISNDVLTQGEVKVYMKIGTEWWSLPYGVGDVFFHKTIEYQYLHILYSKIHGSPTSAPGQITFRVVTLGPA